MLRASAAAPLVVTLLWSTDVLAYRPFDSTDADVAAYHEAEIELGPVGFLQLNHEQFLVAPAVIANVGIASGWELVLEGRNRIKLGPSSSEARAQISDAAFSAKGVLRPGVLQDDTGPSIATEIGALFPATGDDSGLGASAALIISERAAIGTAHLNGGLLFTRSHEAGAFGGLILEGPISWPVRPVAEALVEHEFAHETLYSGLIGAIWPARDHLALDAAYRRGVDEGVDFFEVRAGLTWSFEL